MHVRCEETLLADRVDVADRFLKRLVGLLGRESLGDGEGLFLKNCTSVHCFFMKFPIDVVYLSEDMKVLHKETVPPWRVGSVIRHTRHVLELPQGAAKEISRGDHLEIIENKDRWDGGVSLDRTR